MTARSRRTLIVSLALGAVLLLCMVASAANPIEEADALYALRAKQANAVDQGISVLDKFLAGQPNDYEALWKQARFYWYKGDHQPKGKKQPSFEKAKGFAERAVASNEKGAEGHYWLASMIGSVGQEKGILNSLFMVSPMKKELDRCIEVDPKYADAYKVTAQLYFKVPGPPLSIGNKKTALQFVQKSTVLGPDHIDHWVLYAEIAISLKDYATARKACETAISLPDDPEDPQSSKDDKEKAKDLLKQIEGK